MAHIRDFNNRERATPLRNVEDAPHGMRQELIDLFFTLVEDLPRPNPLTPDHLYRIISQSLGIQAAGNPYGGFRYAAGRDIRGVEWPSLRSHLSSLGRL